MVIDVWSDLVCPFCYIGKRHLATALSGADQPMEVRWHSFLLDETLPESSDLDIYDYLAQRKGQSRDWSMAVHRQVAESARRAGLTYNFDVAKVSSTFTAHRLVHYAASLGQAEALTERLFRAYFTEGVALSDRAELTRLAGEVGLDAVAVAAVLAGEDFSAEVRADIDLARQIGVNGVPFFVFDGRLAVSGAQPPEVLAKALQQAASQAGEPMESRA